MDGPFLINHFNWLAKSHLASFNQFGSVLNVSIRGIAINL